MYVYRQIYREGREEELMRWFLKQIRKIELSFDYDKEEE